MTGGASCPPFFGARQLTGNPMSICMQEESMQLTEKHISYWNKNLTLTAILLSIWFIATFVMAFFARELAAINFFGWPFSFYMAAQGSLIIYVVIIGVYAMKMRKLDVEHGVHEEND
jgi:putative solute:sodium symporter small subunit